MECKREREREFAHIQVCSDPASEHCSTGQGKLHSPLFSAALQNRLTPGLGHCNYTCGDWLFIRCAVTQRHCSSVQGKMHCPLLSAALQNRLTPGLGHCNYTHGDLLSIQMCSDPTEMHCGTGQGKLHSPLFSAALQNRLTAGLGHCSYTLWRFAVHTGVQ